VHFDDPSRIEVIVNGRPEPRGLPYLLAQKKIIIENIEEDEIKISLRPKSNITSLSIKVRELTVAADKAGDFNLEQAWMDRLEYLKLTPNAEPITFTQAKPLLSILQTKFELQNLDGRMDSQTQETISEICRQIDGLIKQGYLKEDFSTFDQIVDALLKKETITEQYANLTIDPKKYVTTISREEPHLPITVELEGKDFVCWDIQNGVLAKRVFSEADLHLVEQAQTRQATRYGNFRLLNKALVCYIPSFNKQSTKGYFYVNGVEHVVSLGNDPFKILIDALVDQINTSPKEETIILSRDDIQLALEQFNKASLEQMSSDPIINTHPISNMAILNVVEVARALKSYYPDRRITIGGDIYRDIEYQNTPYVDGNSDLMAFKTPASLNVQSDGVRTLEPVLISSKVKVLEAGEAKPDLGDFYGRNVILMSGHRTEDYDAYLRELADKRYLEGKTVIIFACNEAGTSTLYSYLTRRGRAKQVLYFPTKINAIASNAVITELIKVINTRVDPQGLPFEEIFNMAVEQAAKKFPVWKSEIERMKILLIQTSFSLKINTANHG